MSDEYGCAEVEALAAELALGVISGPERAAALAHVERCPTCASLVDDLARTGDRLLSMAPGAEPPNGFESRVLGRTGHVELPRPARRRVWLAAAAVLILLAGTAVGVAAARRENNRLESVVEAEMRSPSGRSVGSVYLHGGDPAWVFVAVPGWEPPDEGEGRVYDVHLELRDGATVVVRGLSLDVGKGVWGTTVDIDVDDVLSLALVDGRGRIWCSATIAG